MIRRIKRLLGAGDADMSEAVSHAKVAFLLRTGGAGLSFLFNSAVARLLGAEGAGIYFLALSIMMIGAVIGRLGLEDSLLRFIASGTAVNDANQVKGVFRLGMRWTLFATTGLALAVIVLSQPAARHLFNEPALAPTLRVMALGIVTLSFSTSLSFALKGLKRVGASSLVSGVLHPLVGLIVIWPLATGLASTGAALAYVLGTGVAALGGLLFWKKFAGPIEADAPAFPAEELKASSRPLWVGRIVARGVIPWAPVFFMGVWATSEETAIVGIASRIAMLISLVLQAVNTAVAPQYAKLYALSEHRKLARMMRRFSALLTLAAAPIFVVLVLFSTQVMSLFGEGFEQGGAVLAILAVGQIVNAASGSVFLTLSMSGHEKDVRNTTMVSAALLFLLCVALIPSMGATGAAIAMATTIVGNNVLALVQVRRRLGITAIPGLHLVFPDKLPEQGPKE